MHAHVCRVETKIVSTSSVMRGLGSCEVKRRGWWTLTGQGQSRAEQSKTAKQSRIEHDVCKQTAQTYRGDGFEKSVETCWWTVMVVGPVWRSDSRFAIRDSPFAIRHFVDGLCARRCLGGCESGGESPAAGAGVAGRVREGAGGAGGARRRRGRRGRSAGGCRCWSVALWWPTTSGCWGGSLLRGRSRGVRPEWMRGRRRHRGAPQGAVWGRSSVRWWRGCGVRLPAILLFMCWAAAAMPINYRRHRLPTTLTALAIVLCSIRAIDYSDCHLFHFCNPSPPRGICFWEEFHPGSKFVSVIRNWRFYTVFSLKFFRTPSIWLHGWAYIVTIFMSVLKFCYEDFKLNLIWICKCLLSFTICFRFI